MDIKDWPKVYDQSEDQLVPVTQDWCDLYASMINKMAKKIEVIKLVSSLHPIKDEEVFRAIQTVVQNKSE